VSTEPWKVYRDDIRVDCECLRGNAPDDPEALAQLLDHLEVVVTSFEQFCLAQIDAIVAKQGKVDS